MVFPVESEDRTMRSLLMLCQDYSRLMVEAFRKILAITDTMKKHTGTTQGYVDEIQEVMERSTEAKGTLINELHEIGGVLVSREDFFRLISKFSDIMDHVQSVGARLDTIHRKNWQVPDPVAEGFGQLSDMSFDVLLKFREAVMSMGFNSEKAVGFTREIDAMEKDIDTFYLSVELTVITSDMELPAMLLTKDCVVLIENLVDTVRDASDLIRIIAL